MMGFFGKMVSENHGKTMGKLWQTPESDGDISMFPSNLQALVISPMLRLLRHVVLIRNTWSMWVGHEQI